MRRPIAYLLFLLLAVKAQSQHAWAFRAFPGFLAAHHEDMQAMNSHALGFELCREWKIDSGGTIEKQQLKPYVGLGANGFTLFNNINGSIFSVFGYYDAGIAGRASHTLRVRMTVGTGYLTRQWDPFTNPKNRAIGSHINGLMQAAVYVQTPLTRQTLLQAGLVLTHYSNGNLSQPNLGINMPGLFLGLKQLDKGSRFYRIKTSPMWDHLNWQFSARAGRRQMTMDDPRNIMNYAAEVKMLYPHKPYRKWAFGLIYYYDRTYLYEKFQPLEKGGLGRKSELAFTFGHEHRIGKFGFIMDFGLYLYRPSDAKRRYFEALGLKYYVTPNFAIMNRLKVHLTTADFFEWGVAYQFSSKRSVHAGLKGLMKRGFTHPHQDNF